MIALYIISGIIAFFALLLSFNLSVRVIFDSSVQDEMNIYAKIGFYKIYIIPEKPEKPEKIKRIKKKKEKPDKIDKDKEEEEQKEEKKKYSVTEMFDIIKELGSVLIKRFKKHLKVKIYNINLIIASEEAEKTALLYGAAIQSAYYLYEFLTQNFKIYNKKNNINIIPDFSKIQPSFKINIKFYMRLSHVLALLIASAMKFLKFWSRAKKLEKI